MISRTSSTMTWGDFVGKDQSASVHAIGTGSTDGNLGCSRRRRRRRSHWISSDVHCHVKHRVVGEVNDME